MRNAQILLLAIVTAAACLAAVLLYHGDKYVFLYFGDAAAHIVRTRQFFDSAHPGIHNLGTAWLPLPHLMMLPFTALDILFWTGLAGMAVGLPCLLGAALLLMALVAELSGSVRAGFWAALVFALNPSILYLAMTPMSEAPWLFFLLLAAWSLHRWLVRGEGRWLALCSAALALASLCRYESWPLAAVLTAMVLWEAVRRRRRGARARLVRPMLAAIGSWSGIILWLLWNEAEYGAPFEFARQLRGAGWQAVREYLAFHPLHVAGVYGLASLCLFGPALFALALFGLLQPGRWPGRRRVGLMLVFMAVPAGVTVGALLLGYAQMDKWFWNSRYAVPLALPLLLSSALVIAGRPALRGRGAAASVLALLCLITPLAQVAVPSVGVPTFADAYNNFHDETRYLTQLGEKLGEEYSGGTVVLLTGSSQGQRIMVPSGIPLRAFHMQMNPLDTTLYEPLWNTSEYVVIGKQPAPEIEDLLRFWTSRREVLLRHFHVVEDNPMYELLRRKEIGVAGRVG